MIRSKVVVALSVGICLFAALPATAAQIFTIDPVHSGAEFKIRHFVTQVSGRFTTLEGTISFDEQAIENSSVEVTIQAASIDTNNEKRDGHLKSADFFDVENHPTLTFKSTKVRKLEGQRFAIDGDLTIRGITKPVTLDAEYLGMHPGAGRGPLAGFSATTRINRLDYGVTWNRTLDSGGVMLGDEVRIELNVEATPKEG